MIETREKEISDGETVEKILNLANWCKYAEPRDENERWYNRWIDYVICFIRNYVNTDDTN